MNTINLTQQTELSYMNNPSDSFFDLASYCHDLDVGPYSHLIFPNGPYHEKILKKLRNEYLLSYETISVSHNCETIGEHHFNQQTFLLLIAHIEGEF